MRVLPDTVIRLYCSACRRSLGRYSFDGFRLRSVQLPKDMIEWASGPKPSGSFFREEWSTARTAEIHAFEGNAFSKPEEIKYRWRCAGGHQPVIHPAKLEEEVDGGRRRVYLR